MLLSVGLSLSAYDYQAVYSHRTALFENESKQIVGFKIDSVKFDGDSILYPFKNIQQLEDNCFTPDGASWLGNKIRINKSWNYFFNELNDTIKIKTDATLRQSWILYKRDNLLIDATVYFHDTMTVFGVLDSVKTIELQAYGSEISNFAHGILLLSKHFGLIKTYNFVVFPDYDTHYFFNNKLELHTLVGLTNPSAGVQNLKWFDIHDFQVGDELHINYKYNPFAFCSPPSTYLLEKKTILSYLNRTNYADSIVYQIDKKEALINFSGSSNSGVINHDTIYSTIKRNPEFDKLPCETVVSGNTAFTHPMTNEEWLVKIRPSVYSEIWKSTEMNDSCWGATVADGCFPSFSYYQGMGGPYYECNGMMGESEENKLVYFKKGSTSWGTPLIIDTDYIPLVINNNQWNILHSSCCPDINKYNLTEVLKIAEDTIIGYQIYKKLISAYDSLADGYKTIGYLREDRIAKKVYFKPKSQNEFLLYDFDVIPNDTIKITNPGSGSSLVYINVVLSVDSILIDNEAHKRITLNSRLAGITQGNAFDNQIWIEGIGGTKGLLTSYSPMMTGGEINNLLCFSKNDALIFKNEVYGFDNCFYWEKNTGIDELKGSSDPLVFPNPTNDLFYFKSNLLPAACMVEILDITGTVIFNAEVDANRNSVNIGELSGGLYIFRLIYKGKLLKSGKIVKM